jgi:hypothetical protein
MDVSRNDLKQSSKQSRYRTNMREHDSIWKNPSEAESTFAGGELSNPPKCTDPEHCASNMAIGVTVFLCFRTEMPRGGFPIQTLVCL